MLIAVFGLLATTAAAVLGWSYASRIEKAIARVESLRGEVTMWCRIEQIESLPKIPYLRAFSHKVVAVNLENAKCSDADMLMVVRFQDCDFLNLKRTPITDVGLAAVAKIPALKDLYLSDTQIGDQGVSSLRQLKNLQMLSVRGSQITDLAAPAIAVHHGLVYLDVGETRLGDKSVGTLARLTHLKALFADSTSLTDESVVELLSLPALQTLHLARTRLTRNGLDTIKTRRPGILTPSDL